MSKRIRKKPRTRSAKARAGAVQYEEANPPQPTEDPTPAEDSQLATQEPRGGRNLYDTKDVRTGRKRSVGRAERLKRSQLISALLANGTDHTNIYAICAEQFGMTKQATTRMCGRVLDTWAQDEEAQRPQYKRAAMRRIHGHIAASKKAGKWSSVAQFENLLARIQGTLEPLEVNVNLEATVRESVLHVVSSMDADRLHELAERALAYRAPLPVLPAPPPTSPALPAEAAE